ncbi:hypothetical protein AB0C52_12725 [Streptomyces sp. NPDC048717]|uniref:hypothetical protein n=1 Tax=Streptomyces sp. NPDC048717 TaxID=3154928 RepID=UPI003434C14C
MLSTFEPPFVRVKMSSAQRRAMLAAIDISGHLPINTSKRVLNSIPEKWARTDTRTGLRRLTETGAGALLTVDRYRKLRRANPETGLVRGLNHAEGRGLTRDGLVVFLDERGWPADPIDKWRTGAIPYITPRGRKLVGMPLTTPALAARFPLQSRALWRRPGRPDVLVEIRGWPMTDGKVLVWQFEEIWFPSERQVPVAELRPLPRRARVLRGRTPGPRPVGSAHLAYAQRATFRRRFGGASIWRSGAYGRPASQPPLHRLTLSRGNPAGGRRRGRRPGRP